MPDARGLVLAAVLVGVLGTAAAPPVAHAQPPAAATASSTRPPDIQQAQAVLTRVLSRPEFGTSATSMMLDQLRRRFSEWFLRVWDRLVGRRVAPRLMALTLAWIVTLSALAAMAAWAVRAVLRVRPPSDIAPSPRMTTRKTSRAWAREALAAGDPREAVRCLYNAAVCRLEEEGAWKPDESRTPREYVRLLPVSHARRPAVERVAALFEQVWYRARPASPDDREQVARDLEVLGCARSGRAI